jgi:hypothetical protein
MNRSSIALCSTLTFLILALAATSSHAQGWRCSGDMCEDFILNDIEAFVLANWPASQTLAMPGLPYTCLTKRDTCTHCATTGPRDSAGEASPAISPTSAVSGTVPWSIVLSGAGNLRSFLIGTSTVSADVLGTIQVSADGSTWPSTEVNYVFHEACDAFNNCTQVPAIPSGTTGVVDLGPIAFTTPAGAFWSSSLTFQFTVSTPDIITSCSIGYGNNVTVFPGGTHVTVSYPAASTPVQAVIAEAIRNMFRAGARNASQ